MRVGEVGFFVHNGKNFQRTSDLTQNQNQVLTIKITFEKKTFYFYGGFLSPGLKLIDSKKSVENYME